MLDRERADDLLQATAYDTDDNKIGRVGRVYLDDRTGQPEWVTVQSGLFGSRETFLPLDDARLDGDRLVVPITKDAVKSAPQIDPDGGHLSLEEEQELYRHYGRSHDDSTDEGLGDEGLSGQGLSDQGLSDGSSTAGGYDSGADDDADAQTATVPPVMATPSSGAGTSDEQTTRTPLGIAPTGMRLRRHLVTEDQQITVPVVREEYVLEPDPDADPGVTPSGENSTSSYGSDR